MISLNVGDYVQFDLGGISFVGRVLFILDFEVSVEYYTHDNTLAVTALTLDQLTILSMPLTQLPYFGEVSIL